MQLLNIVFFQTNRAASDVAESQRATLNNNLCQSVQEQSIVSSGRTQATYTSHWGRFSETTERPTLQEYRSRGCLRALRLFWRFASLRLSQAVRQSKKKLYLWKSQFRLSQPTQANTSNLFGRTAGTLRAMSALFLPQTRLRFATLHPVAGGAA
jgi:hypothetical protein